jgi:hypothetical protein
VSVCAEPEPVAVPTPALGCEHVFQRDENDEPTQTPSGFVACGPNAVLYRIAEVPCRYERAGCRCDADCDEGQACTCGAVSTYGNGCLLADCRSSDDCVDGECKVASGDCGSPYALLCTTPADDCVADQDCSTNFCAYDHVEEFFTCAPGSICE